MTEIDWTRLLSQIRDGSVVPVLGPQLLVSEDGASSIQRRVAERLLNLYGIAEPPSLMPFRELHVAVTHLLGINTVKPQELYVDVATIYNDEIRTLNGLPTAIEQMAEISDFRLYVNLTCDGLLASAIQMRRSVREVVHAPKMATDEWQDLPEDWSVGTANEAWILYLFGKVRPAPLFAIHEEDVLEYAHDVIENGSAKKYMQALKNRNLLMIGCGFPDWLGRFFLRLTDPNRLTQKMRRVWFIDDSNDVHADSELSKFMHKFCNDTVRLQFQSPVGFVGELYRRWKEGCNDISGITAVLPKAVPDAVFFVSYSRVGDRGRAQRLVEELINLGCSQSDIWFDRSDIEPGEAFEREIFAGIGSCRYFLPLLSEATIQRDEAFVFKEWRAAKEREKGMNRIYVIPLVVDDDYKPNVYSECDIRWDHLHLGHAPGGVPDDATRKKLQRCLRDVRSLTRL